MNYALQRILYVMSGDTASKTFHFLCLNTLEAVRCSAAAVLDESVNNSGAHSLMRRIIVVGNTAEPNSLVYMPGTQRSDTVVAQRARRRTCEAPHHLHFHFHLHPPLKELAVDATLPAGITSSAPPYYTQLWC